MDRMAIFSCGSASDDHVGAITLSRQQLSDNRVRTPVCSRVVETAAANRHDPIETAYELAYQRPATTAERLEASELMREIARTAAAQPSQTPQTIDGQRVGKLAGLPGTALLLTDREGSAEVLATKQPIELSKQFTIVANLQLQSVYPTGMVRPIISQGALGANRSASERQR